MGSSLFSLLQALDWLSSPTRRLSHSCPCPRSGQSSSSPCWWCWVWIVRWDDQGTNWGKIRRYLWIQWWCPHLHLGTVLSRVFSYSSWWDAAAWNKTSRVVIASALFPNVGTYCKCGGAWPLPNAPVLVLLPIKNRNNDQFPAAQQNQSALRGNHCFPGGGEDLWKAFLRSDQFLALVECWCCYVGTACPHLAGWPWQLSSQALNRARGKLSLPKYFGARGKGKIFLSSNNCFVLVRHDAPNPQK